MKPKRYPYSGKVKPTSSVIYSEWLKAYEAFCKEIEEQNTLQLEIGNDLEERLDTLFHNRKAILNRMKGE